MESVQDTPAKRRRTEAGHVAGTQNYDSLGDSGDDLFNDDIFDDIDTIASLPLPKDHPYRSDPTDLAPSPSTHITQPTQIINHGTPRIENARRKPSIVQVAASSPIRAAIGNSPLSVKRQGGGLLANSMAPPGTAYRPPAGIVKPFPKPAMVDLSDDEGPTYRGMSSDEDSQRGLGVDIKPSTFIMSAQKNFAPKAINGSTQIPPPKVSRDIREITSKSFYKPIDEKSKVSTLSGSVFDSRNRDESNTTSRITAPSKRSADIMANAYGSSDRPPKQIHQTGPAKSQPLQDLDLDEIEDFQLRTKIKRMIDVDPKLSVRKCKMALHKCKFSTDDAMALLMTMENQPAMIDLTLSEEERTISKVLPQQKAPAKQQIKAPIRSIQEKWTSTQGFPRNTQPPVSSPAPTPEKPQRRRLVQGRKRYSSPLVTSQKGSVPVLISSSPRLASPPFDHDSDSGIGSEPEEDGELDCKVLNFFNTCSVADLADIAAITEESASILLSQKPFRDLDAVRRTSSDISASGRRKPVRKPIGDKIVDKCLEMWTGYEAVDELVKRCEALGRPIAEEMKKWGVDVFGASKGGELDLVNFDEVKSESRTPTRDSGIGTPTSGDVSTDEEGRVNVKKASDRINSKAAFYPQPSIMGDDIVLKDYQIVGVNWLSLLFENQLSCILADDMGLGKTCQVIAFLAHLLEKGIKGPHLVVVPGSTLENWLREFSIFCPKLSVFPYYASQNERITLRAQIDGSKDTINVVVTTYGMAKAKEDNKFLRRLKPCVCVYDEGHILKNSKSAGYDQLMRIPAKFRLLLTGTPLQNNLSELASLLGFILPSVFREHAEDLQFIFNHKARTTSNETHAALLSAQRINRARSMMTPFILRRKKYQVLKHLPKKTRRVEYCDLTASQIEEYESVQKEARQILQDRAEGKKNSSETTNIMMKLRKASIHPLLFRRLYTDDILSKMSKACLKEEEFAASDVNLVFEDMSVMTDYELHFFCATYPSTTSKFRLKSEEWMDSGKVNALSSLLTTYKANGDRVLIFSQFVMVMNILEAVMETLGMRFFRLDGSTKIDERQDMIDQFYEEEDITVFLLSTKAGGAGINLACANKVVIFDSSFNPQDDIQAENRAHRVGQKREVEVVRLVTRGTIEEQIHALGTTKLALDDRVAGEPLTEEDERKAEKMGVKAVEEMMIKQIKDERTSGKDSAGPAES